MSVDARRARKIFIIGNAAVALAASAALLAVLGAGVSGVPPLGSGLVPGHGAWRPASRAMLLSASALATLRAVPGDAAASSGAVAPGPWAAAPAAHRDSARPGGVRR